MKTLPLLLAALLAGCAHNPVAPTLRPAAVAQAQQTHWVVTAASYQPAANGLGTITFSLKSGAKSEELAVVAFYNAAPRVLSNSVLVKVDGEQVLDNTHIQDTVKLLGKLDGPLVTKALGWLKDPAMVKY
ncbi:MAG: hypothetical protein JWM80_5738 [Cyanobacteria bacterium RYN_339]|nr:hypothetical protein [Cyanobacteria bacterium RYN_339]